MTKLSPKLSAVLASGLLGLFGCGSDESSNSNPMGSAGSAGIAGSPSAGAAGTSIGAAGTVAGSSAGSTSAGGSGSAGTSAGSSGAAGGGGTSVSAGSGASAGAGGAAGSSPMAGGGGSSGAAGSGNAAGSGGASGAAAAGSGSAPPPAGTGETVQATIVVAAGTTFDGKGKRYIAGNGLGDGSQDEGQQPVFRVEDGATLTNVFLGSPAADGIHCHGDVTLRNIVWEDIGEDAMTIKESGTVVLDGGSATNGDDKVFQINAASTFKVSNFKASNAGKFIRQNGDTTFKVAVEIDACDISNMDEAIFRTDSNSSTVKMTNTRYSNIGDELFIGVAPANIMTSNNTEYP